MVSATTRFLDALQPDEPLKPETIKGATAVFRGTYIRSDSLGHLGFLQERKRGGSICVYVREPQSPPPYAVAYALSDYWAVQFERQATVSLSELAREDGFARLMWMAPHNLEETLDLLRREGVLEVFRTAPPYQVTRPISKESLLPHLYD